MKIEIEKLTPHPHNSRVYGYPDVTELVDKIRESGWVKPILITRNNMIISGHRRVEACKQLGILEIEFEYAPEDLIKQLELFVNENCYREKTTTQKTREAAIYLDIEKNKAYQRMKHEGEPKETFPEASSNTLNGQSRDIAAEKVCMSGRNLDKAMKVVEKMDNSNDEAISEFFTGALNVNVAAASKLAAKSDEEIHQVMEMTDGDPSKVSKAIREIEQRNEIGNLPNGRFKIITFDITSSISDDLKDLRGRLIIEAVSFF